LFVVFFFGWKRYVDREQVKDLKAYLFASVVPIILVFGGRFLYNAMFIPIERQEAVEQTAARRVEEIKNKFDQTIDGLNRQKDSLTSRIDALRGDLDRQKEEASKDVQRCDQEKRDRAANLASAINAIEKDNYPQRLLDAKAAADAATDRKIRAEATYDACRKAGAMGCPGLFGNMQRIEQEEPVAKAQFGQVMSELDSRLNALRGP
jgi:hypothetical protein